MTTTTDWHGPGLWLPAADYRLVSAHHDWARANESDISGLVRDVQAVFRGALRLQGWEHRVKTLDSLARKIATDRLPEDAPPLPQVLADTSDILRYTMVTEPARFSRLTQWAMIEFHARGCTHHSSRNGFTPDQKRLPRLQHQMAHPTRRPIRSTVPHPSLLASQPRHPPLVRRNPTPRDNCEAEVRARSEASRTLRTSRMSAGEQSDCGTATDVSQLSTVAGSADGL